MKRLMSLLMGVCLIFSTVGCSDRINLEDITLALMIGVDLDENDNLVVYMSSPVFNKDVQNKEEEHSFVTKTLQYSTKQFDSVVTAITSGGKLQTLLIGKRILEHPGWFKLLDLSYRNPKLSVNCVVAGVEGPLSEVFFYKPPDKPRLMLHIKKLIETAHRRNITVYTTILELHRQMYEKGETPAITFIKKKKEIEVVGTALLDKEGQYKTMLTAEDNTLLSILKKRKVRQTLTVQIPQKENKGFFDTNYVSFILSNPKFKIKTNYGQEQFNYDIQIKMPILITERLFSMDTNEKSNQLEQLIQDQLDRRYAALFKKLQKYKVDPLGLGLYARAYQYKEWKRVQGNWSEAFAEARVSAKVKVKIIDSGNIQ
ncbi:Ger(x)C family spore germination protein [Paenibacillus psychroresistens]|uniref:Ger(X)C family spore germination protein n=1 Tax=Paenibacillus psychroresistens TaxID=1778678 RepID=A0A6B8RRL9_9BACL|nr:Ger(x)C family spore germination protein [Paenibacillus psychroresistens]QGQ98609.1 Ger(x)C family spore germination protein [Paenibacillus psychroresistens]